MSYDALIEKVVALLEEHGMLGIRRYRVFIASEIIALVEKYRQEDAIMHDESVRKVESRQ